MKDLLVQLLIIQKVLQQQGTAIFWVLQKKTVRLLAELTEGVDVGELVGEPSVSMYIFTGKGLQHKACVYAQPGLVW